MPQRPLRIRLWWIARDYVKRVWDNSNEDNVLFLASGVAFNILLAAVPFFLLMVTGLGYILNQETRASATEVSLLLDRLLPAHPESPQSPAHDLLESVLESRGKIGFYSAIGFIWFSTRLFGTLRTVLANVFDIENERGIIQGKIFDVKVTIVSTMLVVAYTTLSAYLAIATTRGVRVLSQLGIRDETMGAVEYWVGRSIAFAVIALMFFALYKVLPIRKIRWQTALIAALFTSVMIEVAKYAFAIIVQRMNPASLYTGTLYAIVILVIWTYYAALLFLLGGEVGQVFELRRVRRQQREVFET
jgi:membrane protein